MRLIAKNYGILTVNDGWDEDDRSVVHISAISGDALLDREQVRALRDHLSELLGEGETELQRLKVELQEIRDIQEETRRD